MVLDRDQRNRRHIRMNKNSDQLRAGNDEMEATIEQLREEIRRLTEQRDALEKGNLELFRKLTEPDF